MEIAGDEEQKQTIKYLQQWFREKKNLSNEIDCILLTRLYYCNDKDVEQTKKTLENNISLRNKYPKLFLNRDPFDEDTHNAYAYSDMCPLPGLTPANCRVSILRFNDPDPAKMHFTEDIKTLVMAYDCMFSMPDLIIDNTELIAEGVILIFDITVISLKHIKRLSFFTIRAFTQCMIHSYPGIVKSIHLINCPTYVNKLLAVIRPFALKEFLDLIHCHSNGLESLYDHVPRDMLPIDYGGNAAKITDLNKDFRKVLVEKRDYLTDPQRWKIQKS